MEKMKLDNLEDEVSLSPTEEKKGKKEKTLPKWPGAENAKTGVEYQLASGNTVKLGTNKLF
tara:strand:+ start:1779 stop:1961 length:183 start_codon:yes stop_codon:yes gene_type:complete